MVHHFLSDGLNFLVFRNNGLGKNATCYLKVYILKDSGYFIFLLFHNIDN